MNFDRTHIRRISAFILISVFLHACSLIPPAAGQGQLLFKDDFSNPSSGWNRSMSESLTMEYIDSTFVFQLRQPSLEAWSTPGLQLYDARIDVDAARNGGIQGTLYGLICRYQDPDNYYFFLISDDGYSVIGKTDQGERLLLNHPTMLPSESIRTGDSVNHLNAACISNTLSFSVNGTLIAEVEDSSFTGGDVGLLAITSDQPGGEIRYSSFTVHGP